MESSLMVIGLNYRTAPVAVREKFFVREGQRHEVLDHLRRAEAIDEVVLLATGNRTEIILWSRDASAAANSVLRYLTQEHGLRMSDWINFYRLLDEAALLHIIRVASGLDSMVLGESESHGHVKSAWTLAQNAGTSDRYLDLVFQQALALSTEIRAQTDIASFAGTLAGAAIELAGQIFGSLEERRTLLVGSGEIIEASARRLLAAAAKDLWVMSERLEQSNKLAEALGCAACHFEERWQQFLAADIVICTTVCPHAILGRDEATLLARERNLRPLLVIDMAIPRQVDPATREVAGIFLHDLDDLEKVLERHGNQRRQAAAEAEKLAAQGTKLLYRKLMDEPPLPATADLRSCFEAMARQELGNFICDMGPFSESERAALEQLADRIGRRIAASLASELKQTPEQAGQDRAATALERIIDRVPRQPAAMSGD